MEKEKRFLGMPRKAAVIGICIAAFLVFLGAGAFFASTAIVKETSIGQEKAQNFAFADLGIDPLSAENVHTEFSFEQGQFVYEVKFMAGGTEYEYWIKATDGAVVKKEMDLIAGQAGQAEGGSGASQGQAGSVGGSGSDGLQGQPEAGEQGQSLQGIDLIGIEKAKGLALSDAGIARADAVFTKTELDEEKHSSVYDIEFYTSAYEYEYEVDASTGEIYSRDKEAFEKKHDGSPEAATEGAASNIGLEHAKSIAVTHVGCSVSDVVFSKVKLEEEDGEVVYEIKFYKDSVEYEFEISAISGEILKFESERDG